MRYCIEVQFDPKSPFVTHFDGGTREARSPHILDRDHGACGHQFKRGFHQAFFGEWITDLYGGPFFFDCVVKFCGGHCGPTNPIASGFGPKVDDGHADAAGGRVEDFIGVSEACREGVHKTVAVIGWIKANFATDHRHAKAVAVAADASHDAVHKLFGFWVLRLAKG